MEMNHTPGPWIYKAQGDAQEFVLLKEREDGKLDWLVSFRDNGQHWSEHQEANAKLIAAAPELLEACITALADTEGLLSEEFELNPANLKATIETLSKAIKKATA
jgi:hypothetical protein